MRVDDGIAPPAGVWLKNTFFKSACLKSLFAADLVVM